MNAALVAIARRGLSLTTPCMKFVQAPIQVFGLEGRYAHALFSAASKQNKLDAVDKELIDLKALIKKDKVFAEFMADPLVKRSSKCEAINSVAAKKNLSDITKNTLLVMTENGRIHKIDGVANAFRKIMSAYRGEVNCLVTVAKQLDSSARKELEDSLKTFLKPNEKLFLEVKVDPNIIGGLILQIGDRYTDMSISSKLNKLESALREGL